MANLKSDKLTLVNKRVVNNIFFLRNRAKSYRAFCQITKISDRTVQQWFLTNPKAVPTTQHLQKISNAFDVSIDDLVRKDISKIDKVKLRTKYQVIQLFLND